MTCATIQTDRGPRNYTRTIRSDPHPERAFRRVVVLLLALHIVGVLSCFSVFTGQAQSYIAGNLLCIVSYAILYQASSNPGFRAVYPVVLVVTIIYAVVYPLKVFLIASLPAELIDRYGSLMQLALHSEEALVGALWIAALFGVSLSAGVWLLTFFGRSSFQKDQAFQPGLHDESSEELDSVYRWLLVFAGALLLISTGLMAYFGIGVLGQVTLERLPYRLGGIVYYSRTLFLPCLITHIMLIGARLKRLGGGTLSGLLLLGALGLSDTLLTTSRGAVLYYLTFWVLAAWTSKRMYGLRTQGSVKGLLVVLVFATVIATPYVSAYRTSRAASSLDAITDSLREASARVGVVGSSPMENVIMGLSHTIMRLTGIEMLAVYIYAGVIPSTEVLAAIVASGGTGPYTTHTIFGVPSNAAHAVAPSLVGTLYLVGGSAFVVCGGLAMGAISCMLWKSIHRWIRGSAGLAQVMLMTSIIYYMTEGLLENGLFVVAVCASVILVSFFPVPGRFKRRANRRPTF